MYYVYILSNKSHTLYTGITRRLMKRLAEHQTGQGGAFTSRYHFTRLVYFEVHMNVGPAIAREKEIKGWRRSKKVALIQSVNPQWKDVTRDVGAYDA